MGFLTMQGEGIDTRVHWLTGNSGVTIDRGYDLGSRDKAGVINDLKAAAISEDERQEDC